MTESITHKLNQLTLPLFGTRLIEASAGTGKTYTIANLYLRLLLGHGGENAHPQLLTVDQILVVTFTKAAKSELKDRIGRRIHECRNLLLHQIDAPKQPITYHDPFLVQLLLSLSKGNEHNQISSWQLAADILLTAEQQMDNAAIYTIHSFCERMLKQFALDAGQAMDTELIENEQMLRLLAMQDYWRTFIYPQDPNLQLLFHQYWATPEKLLKQISNWIEKPKLTFLPQYDLNQLILDQKQALALFDNHACLNLERDNNKTPTTAMPFLFYPYFSVFTKQLKQHWLTHTASLLDLIEQSDLDKRSYTKKNTAHWLQQISDWSESSQTFCTDQCLKSISYFSQTIITNKIKNGGKSFNHPLFELIDCYTKQHSVFKNEAIIHAFNWLNQRLKHLKIQSRQRSYQDILTDLALALKEDTVHQGQLKVQLQQQFPIALIDEFQDTDPLQYQIFSLLYHHHSDHDLNQQKQSNLGLLMIGDPKQAIYSFRGGDIFTYMKAKKETTEHYNLETNWRSSAAMVNATNRLFSYTTAPFLYDELIPFIPVHSKPNADQIFWCRNKVKQPALIFWNDDQGMMINKTDYQNLMASKTANEIKHLLIEGQQLTACLFHGDQQEKPIKASDIAILVRTANQAQLIKEQLAKQGIASVFLSERNHVFATNEATQIAYWLRALLNPNDERHVKAALATTQMGISLEHFQQLQNNEQYWTQLLTELAHYQQIWFKQGILAMLRSLITQRGIHTQLLKDLYQGERILTNLLHIGELLQKKSQQIKNPHALLHWYCAQLDQSSTDESLLRLESEFDLVKIITIHKSKGLEYNLVFIPFACDYRDYRNNKDSPMFHQSENQNLIIDLDQNETSTELMKKESLAEELRLLYVAITRGVYGCYLGTGLFAKSNTKKELDQLSCMEKTSLGYLIQQGKQDTGLFFISQLNKLAHVNEIAIQSLSQTEPTTVLKNNRAIQVTQRQFNGTIENNWWLTSYSGLIRSSNRQLLAFNKPPSVQQDNLPISYSEAHLKLETELLAHDEIENNQIINDVEIITESYDLHHFDKGANIGIMFHSLLEHIDFSCAASSPHNRDLIKQGLVKINQKDPRWEPVLQEMIDNILQCKLDGKNLQLTHININKRQHEFEFLLDIKKLHAPLLNKLIHQYDPLSKDVPYLTFSPITGALKGFIDLIFEYENKFYLLDWKSNWLGPTIEAYQPDLLKQAIIEHRYDLQYQIYSLALHRYLKQRLPDYNYEQHFGGIYYLFLRGFSKTKDVVPTVSQSNNRRQSNNSGVFFHRLEYPFIKTFDQLLQNDDIEIQELVHQ